MPLTKDSFYINKRQTRGNVSEFCCPLCFASCALGNRELNKGFFPVKRWVIKYSCAVILGMSCAFYSHMFFFLLKGIRMVTKLSCAVIPGSLVLFYHRLSGRDTSNFFFGRPKGSRKVGERDRKVAERGRKVSPRLPHGRPQGLGGPLGDSVFGAPWG